MQTVNFEAGMSKRAHPTEADNPINCNIFCGGCFCVTSLFQVYAVIVAHDESGDLSPAAVSYTSGFYQIPVIGISSRDAAFSDKNIHVSFLRTVPPYFHQANVWLDMLNSFGYNKVRINWNLGNDAHQHKISLAVFFQVIFIHSSDTDGRAILGRFQATSQTNTGDAEVRANVESIVEFDPKLDSAIDLLYELKTAQSRVYLLYAKWVKHANQFRKSNSKNMN